MQCLLLFWCVCKDSRRERVLLRRENVMIRLLHLPPDVGGLEVDGVADGAAGEFGERGGGGPRVAVVEERVEVGAERVGEGGDAALGVLDAALGHAAAEVGGGDGGVGARGVAGLEEGLG